MSEEFDVAVIGSGPGGYVAAIRCAQLGLKTACIEKETVLGGTCLNVGCIPSKALLYSSELYNKIQDQSKAHGLLFEKASYDFSQMMKRKTEVVAGFTQGIVQLFQKNKVQRFHGIGQLKSATTIEIRGEKKQEIQAKSIILATGSEPISLSFLPFDEERVVSSTGALSLKKVPKKLAVIGAGIIGVELGSVYRRLGSEVTFIEFLDRICPTMDETISKQFQTILEKQGLVFHLSSKVHSAQKEKGISLQFEKEKTSHSLDVEAVLVSVGRKPYIKELGLEKVGIKINEKGFIPIDGTFRTTLPNIYAIGDIVDGPMLAHKASEEGVAVAEIIAGHSPQLQYMAIASVIYTSPEVASVGLTESQTKQMGLKIKTAQFPFKTNSRAKCTGEEEGFVKMIAEDKSDRLLGIHILGAHASELITEPALALQKKLTALELALTPHAHPTFSEAVKEAALALHKRAIHR